MVSLRRPDRQTPAAPPTELRLTGVNLSRLDNSTPGYTLALDAAMDETDAAMRVANLNLDRR